MALQVAYTDPETEAEYANAYFRVMGVTMRPAGPTADIHVHGFVTSTASSNGRATVYQGVHRVSQADFPTVFPGTANISTITTRAYNYLKTLPMFAGATDV